MGISAQVSLYPLRQESLSEAVGAALEAFQAHGLDVEPGAMSSVVTGDADAVFSALREAFHRAAGQGHVVMVVTVSNACPVPGRGEAKAGE